MTESAGSRPGGDTHAEQRRSVLRARRILPAVALSVLLISACGDDDGGDRTEPAPPTAADAERAFSVWAIDGRMTASCSGDDVDEIGRWQREESGACFASRGDPVLTAADVESVEVMEGAAGWDLLVQLAPGGQDAFEREIADHVGSRWLVVAGGAPRSVPVVNPDIAADQVGVEGFSDRSEADRAASTIRSIVEATDRDVSDGETSSASSAASAAFSVWRISVDATSPCDDADEHEGWIVHQGESCLRSWGAAVVSAADVVDVAVVEMPPTGWVLEVTVARDRRASLERVFREEIGLPILVVVDSVVHNVLILNSGASADAPLTISEFESEQDAERAAEAIRPFIRGG